MSLDLVRGLAFGLLLAYGAAVSAQVLTVPALQQLLQSAPMRTVPFHELRESPWLPTPVESRGTLYAGSDRLEKRVESPRRETWRLMADRMEWIGPDGVGAKPILYSRSPAVGALSDALRRVVAGDLLVLETDFVIAVRGDEAGWTAKLQPRGEPAIRHIEHLEIHGRGTRLTQISIVERQGERTTTYLQP